MKTKVCELRLNVDVRGVRHDSKAGDRRTIMWRQSVPLVVEQARSCQPIDWGGAMVRAGDYAIVRDDC